ncbi:member of major facilitator superfamily multidrug-resistance, DHA1 sub-family [Amanita rubescens]|nr:member of major facilitator superfamily multidrug-resistance, DHA1 sub-family [Amanita rubescens]KAF8326746.1 member of major facilitator superfamily multidrug-resistance, DHA1 sub-family [Amanita rubescens]
MRHPSGNQRQVPLLLIEQQARNTVYTPQSLSNSNANTKRYRLPPPLFLTLAPLAMATDPRDEEVPLLNSERLGSRTRIEQTHFPWLQFSVFFALETAGYLTLNTQHPFIPDLIRNIGITGGEKNVGYYVGLLTSTIYAAEMATTFFFCRLSDHVGRKPVFLGAIIGFSVCIVGFGLSTTLWTLVLCEALIGALSGTRGLTRSMLTEMVKPTDVARAFAYSSVSWYVSGTIGSKIGGSLSRPVERFPGLFGSSGFLKKYPYFLPCAFCSVLAFATWVMGVIFLKETMEKPLFKDKAQQDESSSSADHILEDEIQSIRKSPPLPAIFEPKVLVVATNLAAISLVEKSYWGTEALYLSTPIADGGLGLSPSVIGTFGSITAIVVGMSQLLIFPPVHAKWGSRSIYLFGVIASLLRFVLWPVMNWIARVEGPASLVLFALGFQICCSALVEFACIAIWILIAQSPRSPDSLARVLGFCQTVAGVLRTVAPAISNSLFSLSIDKGYLGGYLVYFFFVCSSVIALCAASMLPRQRIAQNQQEKRR